VQSKTFSFQSFANTEKSHHRMSLWVLVAVSITASIAASGCRFWLPFGMAKSPRDMMN